MVDPAVQAAARLQATLDQAIILAHAHPDWTITLPASEWSRLVQDAQRAATVLADVGVDE